MKKIIIAIDGHSSCGKSTMAKDLARTIGYIYVDTGAMYRAVTLYAMRNGYVRDEASADGEVATMISDEALRADIDAGKVAVSFRLNEETGRPDTYLNGECVETEIRQMQVSAHVSPIAALPYVRAFLTRQQQLLGQEKGIVMDGRDIGTAVFPNAELKIFVTASPRVRAQRRYDELKAKAKSQAEADAIDFDEILRNLEQRDYIDSHREVAPLRQADDAVVLDNSEMTIDEQKQWLLKLTQDRVSALA